MKALKERLNEALVMESEFREFRTYDELVDFAKDFDGFAEIKSRFSDSGAKAFEVHFKKVKLIVDFMADNEVGCYEFVDTNDNVIYDSGISSMYVRSIDWETLLTNPHDWIDDKYKKATKAAKSNLQKMKTAERKYNSTRKSDDFNKFNRFSRWHTAMSRDCERLKELLNLL